MTSSNQHDDICHSLTPAPAGAGRIGRPSVNACAAATITSDPMPSGVPALKTTADATTVNGGNGANSICTFA